MSIGVLQAGWLHAYFGLDAWSQDAARGHKNPVILSIKIFVITEAVGLIDKVPHIHLINSQSFVFLLGAC